MPCGALHGVSSKAPRNESNKVSQNNAPQDVAHDASHDSAMLKSVMQEVKELKAQVAEGMNIKASIDELRFAICRLIESSVSSVPVSADDQKSGIRRIIGW